MLADKNDQISVLFTFTALKDAFFLFNICILTCRIQIRCSSTVRLRQSGIFPDYQGFLDRGYGYRHLILIRYFTLTAYKLRLFFLISFDVESESIFVVLNKKLSKIRNNKISGLSEVSSAG